MLPTHSTRKQRTTPATVVVFIVVLLGLLGFCGYSLKQSQSTGVLLSQQLTSLQQAHEALGASTGARVHVSNRHRGPPSDKTAPLQTGPRPAKLPSAALDAAMIVGDASEPICITRTLCWAPNTHTKGMCTLREGEEGSG